MRETRDLEERVSRLEQLMRNISDELSSVFVLGRLRIDRTPPTSSSDVNSLDLLYDMLIDETNVYYLIDNSGTLEWRRVAINSF